MDKKQPRKLELNRETVRDLTKEELAIIDGAGKQGNRWTSDPSTDPDACRVCYVNC